MRTFNFLPDYQKNTLRRERSFLIAHTLIGSLLVAVTLAATVLTIARFALIGEYSKIKRDTSLVNVEHLRLESDIDSLNKKVERADKVQASFTKWSDVASRLTALLPPSVTADYLLFNRSTGTWRLNGQAQSREALITAKTALEGSGLFNSLDAPLSNLLEKNNVEFRFTGVLKPEIFIPKLSSP